MPHSLVVVNPRASGTRDAGTRAALRTRLEAVLEGRDGAPPRIVETETPEAVGPLVTAALAEDTRAVIGVGGDGTMRDIATVLAGTDVPLGVVPAGTGNQVASALGIPRSAGSAVDLLETATAQRVDLGTATIHAADGTTSSSTFVIGCGAGFDAQLMASTPDRLKRRIGSAAYFVAGARLALRPATVPCRLTVDGHVIETMVSAALVGNMGQLVPGRLAPRLPLEPADGLLDLIAVDARDPIRGLRGILDQLRREALGGGSGDASIRLRGRHIRIEPAEPMPLEIDGDHIGSGRLEARVLPAALGVLTPPG